MEPAGAEGRWYPPAEAPEPIDQSPHVRIDAGGMPMGNGQAQRGAVAAQRAEQRFSFAEGEPVHLAAATPAPKSGWAVSFAVTDECASVGHGPGEMVSCAHASRAARSGGTSSDARAMAEPDRYSIEIAIPAPDFSPNEAAGERPKGRAKIDDKLPAKAAEKKKIDYQKEWHLCLNAEEQRNRGRVTATDNLLVLLPWQLSAMGRESATPRTDVERYGAVWRAIFAKGPARNISATGLLRKAADFWATRLGLARDEVLKSHLFPFDEGKCDLVLCHLEQTAKCKTAASAMYDDMCWLHALGLEVPSPERLVVCLARPAISVPAKTPKESSARQCFGPQMACDIEWFSVHGRTRGDPACQPDAEGAYPPPPVTSSGCLFPLHVYALAEWAQIMWGVRIEPAPRMPLRSPPIPSPRMARPSAGEQPLPADLRETMVRREKG